MPKNVPLLSVWYQTILTSCAMNVLSVRSFRVYIHLSNGILQASTYLFEYDEADLNPPDLTPNDFFARVRMQFEKFTFEVCFPGL